MRPRAGTVVSLIVKFLSSSIFPAFQTELAPALVPVSCPIEHQALHRGPVDGGHEGADIIAGLGAVVDVIGMLVHIEREDRRSAGERMAMVRGPLVDELAVARRP